jgi:ribose 5-phosphate isomerase B
MTKGSFLQKTIFLGADHRGLRLKEKAKRFLINKNFKVKDMGAYTFNPEDDYPDFAHKVAQRVSEGLGIGMLFCGSGEGMTIAANRYPFVRASLVWNQEVARRSRWDNDANILVVPASLIKEEELEPIINVWLNTPFSKAEKHLRRIKKLERKG